MKRRNYIALLGAALLMACNPDVELCYDSHPHRSHIDFLYDWVHSDGTPPDSMRVMAYRRRNTLKYMMMVTAHASGNVGYMLFPEDEIEPDTLHEGTTALWLHNGEYEVLTYSGLPATVEEDYGDFLQNNTLELDSIKLKYKTIQYVDQSPLLKDYIKWIDSNPYSGFIVNGDVPIYADKVTLTVPVKHDDTPVECRFTPTRRTQKVNVEFGIDPKEEGIVIDEVHAEMSGVGLQMVVGTGVVLTEKTGKVLFSPQCSDTPQAGPLSASGHFYATGIVRSSSGGKLRGPGILQLNVRAHITEPRLDSDGITRLHTRSKVFRATINLYHTLQETPSLVYDPTAGGFVQTQPEITLRIGQLLELTREKVLSHPDSSLDYWIDAGTIVIDI